MSHRREWVRVDYDSCVRESLNLNQVGLRNDQYWFKVDCRKLRSALDQRSRCVGYEKERGDLFKCL